MKRTPQNNLLFSIVTSPLSFLFVSLGRRDYLHRAMRSLEKNAATGYDFSKKIIVRDVGFAIMFLYLGRFKLLLIHAHVCLNVATYMRIQIVF